MMGLLPPGVTVGGGDIVFDGTPLARLTEREWQPLRGHQLAMIFQDPLGGVEPVTQTSATRWLRSSGAGPARAAGGARRAVELTRSRPASPSAKGAPSLPPRVLRRAATAGHDRLALWGSRRCCRPRTHHRAGRTCQARILRLLLSRKQAAGLAMHPGQPTTCGWWPAPPTQVVVMYAGRVAEPGPTREVLTRPAHPYTLGLIARCDRGGRAGLDPLPGRRQTGEPPSGCAFHPRCPMAQDRCRTEEPAMRPVGPARAAPAISPRRWSATARTCPRPAMPAR